MSETQNQNELTPFDANLAMQTIKDKIKSAFVDLIPDAQWQQMVQKEIDEFFSEKPPSSHHSYQQPKKLPSEFTVIVKSLLEEHTIKVVQEYIKTDYTNEFNQIKGKKEIDKRIADEIKNNAGDIMLDMIGQTIFHRLRSQNGRY